MKIIITPETEEEKKKDKEVVWENVFEYAITGRMMREKLVQGDFRYSMIEDANGLKGRLETLKNDIEDHKRRAIKKTDGNTKN